MSVQGSLFRVGLCLLGIAIVAPMLGTGDAAPGAAETETATGERAAPTPTAATAFTAGPSELKRAADGHFYAEAQVNGVTIRFLVDTGASFVALTPEDARRAGVAHGWSRATAMGAGGALEVSPVTIDRVALGPVSARQVQGAVIDELPVSLLGQSFLSRADSMEIRGDRLILK